MGRTKVEPWVKTKINRVKAADSPSSTTKTGLQGIIPHFRTRDIKGLPDMRIVFYSGESEL
jgi:hypothetical protein